MIADSVFTILAIDTSCDDTSVAITKGRKVIINAVSSQIEMHKKTGGVVPIDAARAHEIKLDPLIKFALKNAKLTFQDINAIAVTYGPGLAPALEAGLSKAKLLALELEIPLIPINHMSGHIYANWAQNRQGNNGVEDNEENWPRICLLVSGGHTEIVIMSNHHEFEIVGETLDDACGECFDKVGRMMGLGYPAGPVIEKLAENGDSRKYTLPRPMQNTNDLNVSYSGLKTAAFRLIKTISESNTIENAIGNKTKAPPGTEVYKLTKKEIEDISASFQICALETILIKLEKAIKKYQPKELVLGGGVVRNKLLRKLARNIAKKCNIQYHNPSNKLIMDNAGMIGVSAYYQYITNKLVLTEKDNIENLDRKPGLRL